MTRASARERYRTGRLNTGRSRSRSKYKDPKEREQAISQIARINGLIGARRKQKVRSRQDELAARRFAPVLAQLCKQPLTWGVPSCWLGG